MNRQIPDPDPGSIAAVILDIDGTLYDSPQYVEEQNRVQVEAWAAERGIQADAALAEIDAFRNTYAEAHDGRKTSLANAFASLGAGIRKSIEWRKLLLFPERHLAPDEALSRSLESASKFVRICAVTNNPRSVGERTLKAIGIDNSVEFVVGLDDTMKSKPAREPFDLALAKLGLPASSCLSIGDRYDVDIEVPLSMGMQGALVSGPKDVIAVLEKIAQFHQSNTK